MFLLFATCTVNVCEGNINISLLIALYFPPNWVLHVLLPLECFHLMASQDTSIGYIPGQRDIRPVISRGRGQCLSGAEEVPRASPRHFQGGTKALASPKGCNGSYIPLTRDTTNLYYA